MVSLCLQTKSFVSVYALLLYLRPAGSGSGRRGSGRGEELDGGELVFPGVGAAALVPLRAAPAAPGDGLPQAAVAPGLVLPLPLVLGS